MSKALGSAVVGLLGCNQILGIEDPPEASLCQIDEDCGNHEFCGMLQSNKICSCVSGYTKGVSGCVWTGSIQDIAFSTMTTWTPANGALNNPTAIGGLDVGEVSFLPSTLCSLGYVKQMFDMPAFVKSEPLVLELSYKNQRERSYGDRVLMGASFGGIGWSSFSFFEDAKFHSVRICLPEGGYAPSSTKGKGAPITLALGPYSPTQLCPNPKVIDFAIDHAAIVPATTGECGNTPGEGPNFDAESAGGWTFAVSGSSSGTFVGGIGVGGTRAARVMRVARCDLATMDTWFNVPNIDNPALEMFVGTSMGVSSSITFGYTLLTMSGPPGGTSTMFHTCLPPSLRGQAMDIQFSVDSTDGLCSDIVNQSVFVDNVRVVNDPNCASTDYLSNAGFEHGDPFGASGITTNRPSPSQAIVRDLPGQAHSGTKYLSLESYGRCTEATMTMLPIVPFATSSAGPALKFFANVGANPDAITSVKAAGSTSQTLLEGVGYQSYTVCLNPLFSGRPQPVVILHQGGNGNCDGINYGQQNALIDDIEVTTDPNCPPR